MNLEKRANRRYECLGEAMIIADPDSPGSKGKIKDLSLGGCKIEFAALQNLVVDQKVEIIFSVHNLPFRLTGVFKGKRGALKYGFEFPPMRERIRIQLEDLIDELKVALFRPKVSSKNTLHC